MLHCDVCLCIDYDTNESHSIARADLFLALLAICYDISVHKPCHAKTKLLKSAESKPPIPDLALEIFNKLLIGSGR